jgi:hypothetical protein
LETLPTRDRHAGFGWLDQLKRMRWLVAALNDPARPARALIMTLTWPSSTTEPPSARAVVADRPANGFSGATPRIVIAQDLVAAVDPAIASAGPEGLVVAAGPMALLGSVTDAVTARAARGSRDEASE